LARIKWMSMKQGHAFAVAFLLSASLAFAQADSAGHTPEAQNPSSDHRDSVRSESIVKVDPAPSTLSPDQIKELIRKAAEKDIENDKKQKDYNYSERVEEHKLDGKGGTKSTEVHVYDVLQIYGEEVERLVSKDGKPLSEKDAKKEDEKIQKIIDKRKNESDSEREKRLKKEEKDREHGREFVKEVADAYNFTYVGTEDLQGRESYVIDAQPRPGFEPHTREGKILPKFRFRLWLDRAEDQWVKLDATCIDTVSWGLFIARIHQGSRVLIETTRVNDEVWLPQHIAVHFDAKLALLKTVAMNVDFTYKDYKKFQSQTRIVGMEEVKEQH
jgi:hypothetical protein